MILSLGLEECFGLKQFLSCMSDLLSVSLSFIFSWVSHSFETSPSTLSLVFDLILLILSISVFKLRTFLVRACVTFSSCLIFLPAEFVLYFCQAQDVCMHSLLQICTFHRHIAYSIKNAFYCRFLCVYNHLDLHTPLCSVFWYTPF